VLRFRLLTLLLLTTVVAVGLTLWSRFVRPNIAGVSLQGGTVLFHMTDEFTRGQLSRYPELNPLYPEVDEGFVFHHDSYISVPLVGLATGIAVLAGLAIGTYYVSRGLWNAFRVRRRMVTSTQSSPSGAVNPG
jgi:hypothetical protein